MTYNADSHCAKCGFPETAQEARNSSSYKPADDENEEMITRGCGRCGYSWNEEPID